MGNSLVIVALPEEDDRVHKISSEEAPHLTLLYLGDVDEVDNVDQIVQFVQHAVELSEHGPFYLDVDHRGELGEENADVIFFNKRSYNVKWAKQFRGQLLQNEAVRTAYDSAPQYGEPQEWVPHLTLGYPDTPANDPDEGDGPYSNKLYSVCFDRIAVWTGENDGPEFRLEWPERDLYEGDLAVAYSDAMKGAIQHYMNHPVEGALEHYGVKGMRWGQRKSDAQVKVGKPFFGLAKNEVAALSTPSQVALVATGPLAFLSPRVREESRQARGINKALNKERKQAKKDAKADKKWEKQVYTTESAVKVHNAMADHFNERIDSINSKPKYDKLNLIKDPDSQLSKDYMKEVDALTHEGYRQGVQSVHGRSPSGKKVAELGEDGNIRLVDADKVKHADVDDDIVFMIKYDADGKVVEMNKAEEMSVVHTADLGAAFLEHYGVKGMRWGVRNARQVPRSGTARANLSKHAVRGVKKTERGIAKTGRGAKKAGRGLVKVAKDVYFETDMAKDSARNKVTREASKNWAEKDVPRLNAEYAGTKGGSIKGRLKNPLAKETIEYRSRSRAAYRDRLNEAVAKHPGNASGTRRYEIEDNGKSNANYIWDIKVVDTKKSSGLDHAAKDEPVELVGFRVAPTFDDDGFIIGFKQVATEDIEHDAFNQTASLGEEFIKHYGVKGMRWGIRNRRGEPVAVSARAESRVPHGKKRKTKLVVEGGENHPASEDAVKVAEARSKLKKSGPAALSNKELQEVANRIQLEERVNLLTSSRGRKYVRKKLDRGIDDLADEGLRRGAGRVKKVGKGAAKAAATAALFA